MNMKRVILVIFAITILFSGYCNKPAEQTINQEETIESIIKDFYKKFDYKDTPGMLNYFRDDFLWYSINGLILKKDQFEGFFAPIVSNWKTISTEVTIFDIRVDGNLAVARFGTRIQTDNKLKTMKNLHTMVFIYQFGEWKMWHHQESMQ